MPRVLCLVAGLLVAGSLHADSPSVADLVRQLGDPKFAVREAAQRELVKRGEGIVPELDRLTKGADPETADRIAKVRFALVGYKDAIRRLLADIRDEHELDSVRVPVSDELRGLVAAHQPGSGDFLLSILAESKHKLHRQTLSAFVATWDVATPDQIDAYIHQAVTLNATHRPKFPAKVAAMISCEAQLRDGWTGWPNPAPTAFLFRTRTTRYLDGKPYDKPFDYQYPFATVGWYRVGELAEGKHTIHAALEYEFTQNGRKRRGQIRSNDSTFEVVSADTPDDLVAPRSKELSKAVRESLVVQSHKEPAVMTGGIVSSGGITTDYLWTPQVSWRNDKGDWTGVHCPVWEVRVPLDVDLCFDVAIRDTKTGTAYPADPIVVQRRVTTMGYVIPRDPRAFAKDRVGFAPVTVTLKPSRALALSEPKVTGYFAEEITSGELKMKVIPKIEPVKGP
jgi:hypothetical protein